MSEADTGLFSLAVMGETLPENGRGRHCEYRLRPAHCQDRRFRNDRGVGKLIYGTQPEADMCHSLAIPRRAMIMANAGAAVDSVIESLMPGFDGSANNFARENQDGDELA